MPVCNADHVSGTHDADPASRRVASHPGTRDADLLARPLGLAMLIMLLSRRVFGPGVLGRREANSLFVLGFHVFPFALGFHVFPFCVGVSCFPFCLQHSRHPS